MVIRATSTGERSPTFVNDSKVESTVVQNNWYEAVHLYNVEVLVWEIFQTNTETDAKDCEVRLIADGETVDSDTKSVANNSRRYVQLLAEKLDLSTTPNAFNGYVAGKDVSLKIRTTSAPGTAQTLKTYIAYLQH